MNWAHAVLWRMLRFFGGPTSMPALMLSGISFFMVGFFGCIAIVSPAASAITAGAILLLVCIITFGRCYQIFGIGRAPTFSHLAESKDYQLIRHLRFVAISDTHSMHRGIRNIPDGDVLIHAGDFAVWADDDEVAEFNDWLGTLPHKHKVVIAGNHDFTFDRKWGELASNTAFWEWGVEKSFSEQADKVEKLLTNCTYLHDELLDIDGCKIYATPAQPPLAGVAWAFTDNDEGLIDSFSKIPEGVDVLLTHSPPYGHGDRTLNRQHYGCKHLLAAVKRAKPRFHVFGHIHDGYGVTQEDSTIFINASTTTTLYEPHHAPIVFDVSLDAPADPPTPQNGFLCCNSGRSIFGSNDKHEDAV